MSPISINFDSYRSLPSIVILKRMNHLLGKMLTKVMRMVINKQLGERGRGFDVNSPDVCLGSTTYRT